MDKLNKRAVVVLTAFIILFTGLIVYLSYFQVFKSASLKNHPFNKRLWANEEKVKRGSISDRNGLILAESQKNEESNKRIYNYGALYSHIIGYSSREFGKSGLELRYNNELLNINPSMAINDLKNIVLPSSVGNNLELTIDHSMQEKSRSLLSNYKGSVITMNPKTGEIYSMVSLPDFDASNLNEVWKDVIEDNNSPLLNRATQGLYAPGSIFKVITTSAILNSDKEIDLNYNCTGQEIVDGYTFTDYGKMKHGNINLSKAFINSCNTYYASKSQVIKYPSILSMAEAYMFNQKIDFDLDVKTSQIPKNELIGTSLSATAIGQGDIQTTPLNMLLTVSTIANDGKMMKPYLVKNVYSDSGRIIRKTKPEELSRPVDPFTSIEIANMMREVVKSGTGKNASIKNVKVAGKTGTAENGSGKTHSWFMGYAPFDDPKIAVVVVLEESGLTGGKGAAPIARDLIIHGLNNINFEE